MAVGVQKAWSTTASSNGSADTNVNFAEGQLAPTLNNSSRAAMAAIKGWANQIAGGCSYGGSSNAYTITSDAAAAISTAYGAGMMFMLKANHTNTGAATLNVDSVGAVAIKTSDGGDVVAGDIVSGGLYLLAYNATGPRFDLIGTFAGGSFQPLDATLTAVAGLSFSTTNAYFRATDVDTFVAESASSFRTSLGLGTAALATIGTSGDTVPKNNASNQTSVAGLPLRLTNTTNSASVQGLIIEGDRSSPATNDSVYASFNLSNASGTQVEFARIVGRASSVTAGSESGALRFATVSTGSLSERLQLSGTALSPITNGGLALGAGSAGYSNAFIESGGTINFGNSNYTLTHSSGLLTTSGALTVGGALTAANGGSLVGNFSGGIPVFQGGAAFIDSTFYTAQFSTSMLLLFDTGDALGFDRSTNIFSFNRPLVAQVAASTETSGTLTVASANRQINATGGITIPASVFAAGDIITIYAGSSSRTLTQGGGGTQRLHGSATTGNLTLAARGVAGIRFISSTEWVVTGDVS